MAKYRWALNVARNAAIGGLAGAVAGRTVSDSLGADISQTRGLQVGAAVGAATGLPFGRLAKTGYRFSKVVARGLKATPSSKVGGVMRAASSAGKNAGVVFKRIRGRIVPIRKG
jgi:hypothetical protein